MSENQFSLNLSALFLINKLCSDPQKYGVIIEKTSSGATLIDAGIDILSPLQTNAANMNPQKLKREFGKDLVFWGGGCDSKILSFGSVKEVEEEVKRNIDALGKDGGFVFAPILLITPEVPPENIIAMYKTAFEYG